MRAHIILALTASLAAAAPASAGDRTFAKSRASLLTEDHVGQTLWSLLASCAGAQGAAHAYFAERSRVADAAESKAEGTRFLELAVDRLVVDRRVSREDALKVTLPTVEQGRANGLAALAYPRQDKGLKWMALRTACDEIAGA
jgi:hypothetical protein